jgi:hypothetical protein
MCIRDSVGSEMCIRDRINTDGAEPEDMGMVVTGMGKFL